MRYLRFKIFEKYKRELKCGLSTRHGGVSVGCFESLNLGIGVSIGDTEDNLAENYKRFCEAVGVDENKIVLAVQEHTDQIFCVKEAGDYGWQKPVSGVDGFTTNMRGVPLMVRFADCQGVFMFDPAQRVVAAVHSGWRGNVQNIIGKSVRKMIDEFGCKPENILVGISPAIGPCCAEFNLWQCSLDQLTEAGVFPQNIEIMQRCTSCESKDFFSYRRDKGKTGRMGGVIELM